MEASLDENVIFLNGELAVADAETLRSRVVELVRKAGGKIIVDVSRCHSRSMVIVPVLLGALRKARAMNGSAVLRGVSPALLSILELTDLDDVIPMVQ
ncbi:hypothetical protein WH50_08280 [Pokkaliibacter plantistimulans]|uniref:STAS domain-containing protein n=1 Tax=Pokkaliibacter plantistimulans TaxID=1635171 RepID=A0ABX5LYN7_9GAMM|nr:STAS domain-containing protein [Pokkaliibacter plantistimulans]PXF31734.1 hypothetical protein WH50_08280 [Pokkaliibacter plantistimulans]